MCLLTDAQLFHLPVRLDDILTLIAKMKQFLVGHRSFQFNFFFLLGWVTNSTLLLSSDAATRSRSSDTSISIPSSVSSSESSSSSSVSDLVDLLLTIFAVITVFPCLLASVQGIIEKEGDVMTDKIIVDWKSYLLSVAMNGKCVRLPLSIALHLNRKLVLWLVVWLS